MLYAYQIKSFGTMTTQQLVSELWQMSLQIRQPIALTIDEIKESVNYEEYADDEGHLLCGTIPEMLFCESLSRLTDLDIRAVSECPKELGLYTIIIWIKQANTMIQSKLKVWIVPVANE